MLFRACLSNGAKMTTRQDGEKKNNTNLKLKQLNHEFRRVHDRKKTRFLNSPNFLFSLSPAA